MSTETVHVEWTYTTTTTYSKTFTVDEWNEIKDDADDRLAEIEAPEHEENFSNERTVDLVQSVDGETEQ